MKNLKKQQYKWENHLLPQKQPIFISTLALILFQQQTLLEEKTTCYQERKERQI